MALSRESISTQRFTSPSTGTDKTPRNWVYFIVFLSVWGVMVFTDAVATPLAYDYIVTRATADTPFAQDMAQVGLPLETFANYLIVIQRVADIIFFGLSLVVAWQRSDRGMALLTAYFLVLSTTMLNSSVWYISLAYPQWSFLLAVLFWVYSTLVTVWIFIFPDGKLLPNRQWMGWLLLPLMFWYAYLAYELVVRTINLNVTIMTPSIIVTAAAIAMLFVRYRRGGPALKHQIRWVIFGFGVWLILVACYVVGIGITPLLRGFAQVAAVLVVYSLPAIATTFLGITIGISILRFRLYDIDWLANRSLVFVGMSVFLLVVFASAIFILQNQFGGTSSMGFIVATLVAGGLFNPVRRVLQDLIDRRVFGLRYNLNQLAQGNRSASEVSGNYVGTYFGAYLATHQIAVSGMSHVYRGKVGNDLVAIKVLSPSLTTDPESRARFVLEPQTLAMMDHPAIPKVYENNELDNRTLYFVMPFFDAIEMKVHIREQGRLLLEETFEILDAVVPALDHAHSRGIVHRDIKPANILLCKDEDNEHYRPVLIDFGISKVLSRQENITGTNAIGTIDYMAPEQIKQSQSVTPRTDIYALAVVVYEMLSGERPFKGDISQVVFGHTDRPAPDIKLLRPDLPDYVAIALMRAMSKDPQDRYTSASDFLAALKNT